MIVVSDTSPLNYLILIGHIDVLPAIFTDVYTTPAVIAELHHQKTPALVKHWFQHPPSWLKVVAPTTTITLAGPLGAGETTAISLAKELNAFALLIDEREGANVAINQGLAVIGTLAVLEMAASLKLLNLHDAIRRLRQTTFRMSPIVVNTVLLRHAVRNTKPDIN